MDADGGDVQKGSAEIFFRKAKFWKEDDEEEAPPVFVGIFFLSKLELLTSVVLSSGVVVF